MLPSTIISNERQAREVAALIEEINQALSSEQSLKAIVEGLPREVIDGVRRSLTTEKRELAQIIEAYQQAKEGNFEPLKKRAESDLGELLIVARIAKNWSQKDLARKLGLREQAIQRYEAERYQSISLANFLRVARALSVRISGDLEPINGHEWIPSFEGTQADVLKVLKHARAHGWSEFEDKSDIDGASKLIRYVTEHVEVHGTPSLLRAGLNVENYSNEWDWFFLSWKAQVTRRAEKIIQEERPQYRPLNVAWLRDLVQLSVLDDGPSKAKEMLLSHGIVLVVERQIPGMKIDGCAFLLGSTPVIGMTLLRDTLDNFWFTLLHEVAHVILHYRTGLAAGFFDDIETSQIDEVEAEANLFASNLLIPEELWAKSPARIAKTAEPIERFANHLGISPAIVFGRVRLERKNFSLFSDKIGRGKVRQQFFSSHSEVGE